MKVDTRDIRSATQAARTFGAIVDEVEAGATIVVVKNNKPVTAFVPIATMDRLDDLDEREEDLRLLALALTRVATSGGALRDWDEVAADLGIDLAGMSEDGE